MNQATIINDRYLSNSFRDLLGKTFPVIDELDRTILLDINDKERAPHGLQIRRESVKLIRKMDKK
jgi:hypothetical protein